MEIFLCLVILGVLMDIEDKLKKQQIQEKKHKLDLGDYLDKNVYIVLDNDNVSDSYLFSSTMKTIGRITDYDENWFVFCYYDKSRRKNITQYLKISDLKSVNVLK